MELNKSLQLEGKRYWVAELVLTAEQKEVELQIQRAGGFHRLEVAFPMYNLEAKRGVEKSL